MTIKMKKYLLLFLCFGALAHGSLRLHNDSPYKLRAVIRAADGTYLGEMVILPEHFNTWSESYPSFGPGGQNYGEQPSRSQTPYTVQWSCLDGGEYGICTNVASGAAVLAGSCDGPKYCKPPKKKKKGPYGAHPDDEQLQDVSPESSQ
ncbi:MAG: hypothetical protein P0S96_08615 [Simkaniaceae bacterium]|nr:hypothetical protein [Candidatus Sacchlamyda saccharinae]